jgi:predicted O-methyltransferase YrrM
MQDHMLDLYTWGRGWPKDPRAGSVVDGQVAGCGPDIIELGVRSGNSTSAFLAALETDRRGTLWSCDISAPDVPASWHDLDYWRFIQEDCLGEVALALLPSRCDVLFVDVDPHSYAQTLEICARYVPRVRYGGVALFHDTDPRASSPVSMALDEYCRVTTGAEWRNKSGCHGLGIMRVR